MRDDDNTAPDAVSTIGIALAYISIGAVLVAGAAWSLRIDIGNNWKFGSTFSDEIADAFMGAAALVAFLPIAIRLKIGHWVLLPAIYGISLIISVTAALLAYSTTFGGSLDTVQNSAATNLQTAADLTEQRAIYDRVKYETGDVKDLEESKKNAESKNKTDCRNPRAEECNPSRKALDAILARLSTAKARDKAEAEIKRLEAKQEIKPATKQNLDRAKNLGSYFQTDAKTVAGRVYNGMMSLITILTVMLASALDPGIEAIWHGWKMLPSFRKKPEQPDASEQARHELTKAIVAPKTIEEKQFDKLLIFIHKGGTEGKAKSWKALAEGTHIPETTLKRRLPEWKDKGFIDVLEFEGSGVQVKFLSSWRRTESIKRPQRRVRRA